MGGQGEVTLIVYILLLRANHRRHCEEELSDVAISSLSMYYILAHSVRT